MAKTIIVQTTINAPIEKVWEYWTNPTHIVKWNFASDDWEAPHAENDLKVDGKFKIRMQAKDKSAGFDFEGIYSKVENNKRIEYSMADGRKVTITFEESHKKTKVTETFEMEDINSEELQRNGWQAILNNFKKHVEIN